MSVREPAVAGQFYSGGKKRLEADIEQLVDSSADRKKVLGAVSPHAGYMYSGSVAGCTLSRIEPADCYIIIGPNHTGLGAPYSVFSEGVWKTPLGSVEVDSELAKRIVDSSRHLQSDTMAHLYEHSIEVQLPFLQYFNDHFKIVPIILQFGSGETLKEIGREISNVIKSLGRSVVIIASSDMTHHEPHQSAREKDRFAIDAMLDLDEDRLLREVREREISMCGIAPAVTMLSAVKELGAKKAELIKYQTSGDSSGDYSAVVGYAGILFE